MPAPFPTAREGEPVARHPTGFPAFFRSRKPRIVTADIWSLLRHLVATRLEGRDERIGLAYVQQAFEFFEAASNPRTRSKPLLYYYSFLNLAKAALVFEKIPIPPKVTHGISDPEANTRRIVRLEGQHIRISGRARDHSALFPEFVAVLGGATAKSRLVRVVDILAQIPSIHRTYCHVVGCEPRFAPVTVEALRAGGNIWARLQLDGDDTDVQKAMRIVRTRRTFRSRMHRVAPPPDVAAKCIWFETDALPARTNATDKALGKLAQVLQHVGVWTILTSGGYRSYLCSVTPRQRLPALAAPYAAFFYLGSITRYKPYDFDTIVRGGYSWLVGELINTQPTQFLYCLASWLAGVDVVRPYATTS